MINDALATQRAIDHATNVPKFKLHIFSGVPPSTRAALTGSLTGYTRLATYQRSVADGAGSFGMPWVTPTTPVLSQDATVAAQATAAATGYGTFVVITSDTDALGATTTDFRQLKTIGTSGSGTDFIQVSNTYYEAGRVYPWASTVQVTF